MDNIFEKRLKSLGINKQVDAAMVVAGAQETIRKELGTRGEDNLQVISFSKGLLKIAATSGAWAAECRSIITKIAIPPVERVIFVVRSVSVAE